jgi:hypothetical protein
MLTNNPKFKEEYQKITEYIETVEDQNKKIKMKNLLHELISDVKKIDINHSDMIMYGKLSEDTSLIRQKIFQTRKKIFSIIDKK